MHQDYSVGGTTVEQALSSAATSIDNLSNDSKVETATIEMFRALLIKLPDLIIYRPDDANGNCWPCSPSLNKVMDHCTMNEQFNKFEDKTYVYAWPSTIIDSYRVYSDPPGMIIGVINTSGFGIIPSEGLEDRMDKVGLSFKVVKKIREYLASKPAIHYM